VNACFCGDENIARFLSELRAFNIDRRLSNSEGLSTVGSVLDYRDDMQRRTQCRKGHDVQLRSLGRLEGRVKLSECQVCLSKIPRKEARYSCQACHYNVCRACYAMSSQTTGLAPDDQELVSWMYADLNPIASRDPLRWSSRKSFGFTLEEVLAENTDFARPITVRENDSTNRDIEIRRYKASSLRELHEKNASKASS